MSVNYENRVFVSDSLLKQINVFEFDKNLVEFRKMNEIQMEDHPDNIHVDIKTKEYYIGTVSKTIDFLNY